MLVAVAGIDEDVVVLLDVAHFAPSPALTRGLVKLREPRAEPRDGDVPTEPVSPPRLLIARHQDVGNRPVAPVSSPADRARVHHASIYSSTRGLSSELSTRPGNARAGQSRFTGKTSRVPSVCSTRRYIMPSTTLESPHHRSVIGLS